MTQPEMLTEAEKRSLQDALTDLVEGDDDQGAVFAAVAKILKERLAAATVFQLADVTLESLPLPSILFHQTTVEQFKMIVAAFPDVDWTADGDGASQHIAGTYKGHRITVWSPREPDALKPAPQRSWTERLLAEAKS